MYDIDKDPNLSSKQIYFIEKNCETIAIHSQDIHFH